MNKFCIITGASAGIGKGIATLFHMHGWQIMNISRNICDIPETINLRTDLLQPHWADPLTEKLKLNLPDKAQICLVHNAALCLKDRVDDLAAQQLRQVMELNVIVPSMLNQILLPMMGEGSSILYIGSTLSEQAVAGAASYVTSKHAVAGLMKSTCQDLANYAIHTSCICPGFTNTEMLRQHLNNDPEIIDSIASRVAAKRLIEPSEIAELTLFCANNPVINGSVLHAHLGQLQQ